MMEVSSPLNMTSRGMYTSLIQALCLSSQVEEAIALHTEMIKRGIKPDLSLFVCLIKGLIDVDKWNEALQLCYGICQEVSPLVIYTVQTHIFIICPYFATDKLLSAA
jgi:pentatricopeptide repeat protein